MKLRKKTLEESLLEGEQDEGCELPMLSTGCTLLNLALADNAFGGFQPGKYYYFVGDSTSGKTFFTITCFAEALRNDTYKHYRRIYDNVEDGMLMDTQRLFGSAPEALMEPPRVGKEGEPVFSETIEEFYYHLDDAVKDGRPFIYVLDSMDGLDAAEDVEKFDEQKKAHRKGKDTAGSYGMAKAKKNSTHLRKVVGQLRKTGSILIIISQTRANLGFGYKKKTRSGGKSLKFYASVEIWTACGLKVQKTVRGKKRKIGTQVKIHLEKNRITGKLHEVTTMIYPSYGVDDIGSNIDYLVDEKWWTKSGQKIKAKEFKIDATRDKLIREIEKDPRRIKKLQYVTGRCWAAVQKACEMERKPRYE